MAELTSLEHIGSPEHSPLYLPHHHTSQVLNRGLVELPHERDMVTVWEVAFSLLSSPSPFSPPEILELISVYTGRSCSLYFPPEQLTEHFQAVRKYGLMLAELFPTAVIFRDKASVSLSILQTKCLLSHMLLGTLPGHLEWKEESRASAYYRAVLLYYLSLDIDSSSRSPTCTLCRAPPVQWDTLPDKLPAVDTFSGTIENHPTPNKVVFSNKEFGPGPGGTQEELIFGSYPESCVFPLFFSRPLAAGEAMLISRVLRVAGYSGYGREVEFAAFLDPFAKPHTLLLMDALEVDLFEDKSQEFSEDNVARELNKCFCGFSQFTGEEVATGRWGCGSFGGTFSLKKRIQQFAANRAKVKLVFCEPEL